MAAAAVAVSVVAALVLVSRRSSGSLQVETLQNVKAEDFVNGGFNWLPYLDPELVQGVDRFISKVRSAGGNAWISPAAGSLGRETGSDTSQHYAAPGQPVRAADVFVRGVSLERAVSLARSLGVFSGIGAYTDTSPANMVHLDTRTNRTPQSPATWSRVAGVYQGLAAAFA